jgi:uncharacterized protein (TIGR03083 family)
MPEMDDKQLQPLVAAEFAALADILERLPGEAWDSPSMCEGWRVREVVAHMTMAARYDEASFMAELKNCEFDFTRLSNRIAARDGLAAPSQLLADLRSDVMAHWTPPGGGYSGALNHVVIHGLDVAKPLGDVRRPPEATMRVVLDDLTGGGIHAHFETDISGRTLQATDIDWSYGTGPQIGGTAGDLALHLCGRKLPIGSIHQAALGG